MKRAAVKIRLVRTGRLWAFTTLMRPANVVTAMADVLAGAAAAGVCGAGGEWGAGDGAGVEEGVGGVEGVNWAAADEGEVMVWEARDLYICCERWGGG